jgi:hypothetical protein
MFAIRDQLKVIISSEQALPQLYDLSQDPDEAHDLWGDPPSRARAEAWLRPLIRSGEGRQRVCKKLRERCPLL